jgi:hypothetical protein
VSTGLRAPLLQDESKGDLEAGEAVEAADEDEDEEGKAKAKKKKGGASIGRLLSLSRPERGLIVAGTVALFLSSISTMFLPVMIGRLIDDVGGQGGGDKGASEARRSLDRETGILLVILLVGSAFTFVRGVCFNLGAWRASLWEFGWREIRCMALDD